MLTIGNRVIYPRRGPCVIDRISTEVVNGAAMEFYHLVFLDDSRGGVLVPVEKAQAIGVRALLKRSQIPKLFERLAAAAAADDDSKLRATNNRRLLSTGSAFDLAEVVASLTALGRAHTLSPTERRTLETARGLLICEVSEVIGTTLSVAEAQLDTALARQRPGSEGNGDA
jgi:CarD family transcriptional regulator